MGLHPLASAAMVVAPLQIVKEDGAARVKLTAKRIATASGARKPRKLSFEAQSACSTIRFYFQTPRNESVSQFEDTVDERCALIRGCGSFLRHVVGVRMQ